MGPRRHQSSARTQEEPARRQVVLLTNGVSWYLRSHLMIDRHNLEGTTPRTMLGLLPIGERRFAVNLRDVRATLGTKLHPDRLLVALLLGLWGAFGGLGTAPRAIVIVGAVAFLLLGFIAAIRIEDQSSRPVIVPVCLAHLPRARRFVTLVTVRSSALRAMPIQEPGNDRNP